MSRRERNAVEVEAPVLARDQICYRIGADDSDSDDDYQCNTCGQVFDEQYMDEEGWSKFPKEVDGVELFRCSQCAQKHGHRGYTRFGEARTPPLPRRKK